MKDLGTGFVIVATHVILGGILVDWIAFRIRQDRRNRAADSPFEKSPTVYSPREVSMAIDEDKVRQVYEAHMTDLKNERDHLQTMREEAKRQFHRAEDHLDRIDSQILNLDERIEALRDDIEREFDE